MTKRPDSQDHAAARHQRCLCGDGPRCTCGTPSQGWRPWSWRPLMGLVFGYLQVVDRKQDEILKEIRAMSVNVDELNADIQTIAAGYGALQTENAALKAALASADADKAQAVADAVAAEDADAQAKIDAADAVVDAVINPPAPVEEPPADAPPADEAPAEG